MFWVFFFFWFEAIKTLHFNAKNHYEATKDPTKGMWWALLGAIDGTRTNCND